MFVQKMFYALIVISLMKPPLLFQGKGALVIFFIMWRASMPYIKERTEFAFMMGILILNSYIMLCVIVLNNIYYQKVWVQLPHQLESRC